jgi:hypothetical protein
LTIQNRDWLVAQITRMYLSGFPQEEISIELKVSEGTVNAMMQEVCASNDMLKLQHEVAVVLKKSGLSIKELASNMAFANAIKKLGFEQNKIDLILKAIDSLCRQDGSLEPDTVATLLTQTFDLILKNQISLAELPKEIVRIYSGLNELNEEINQTKKSLTELKNQRNKALAEYSLTLKELENFARLRGSFEEAGLDFENREVIHNVLCNIREMDYDAQNLIEEVKNIRVIKLTKSELQRKCEELEKNLEIYQKKEHELQRNWSFLFPAIEVIKELLRRDENPVTIYNIFDVLSKHQPYLSINDLAKDIDTYGGIEGAIFKKKRELENLTIYMQTLDSSRHAVS